SDRSTDGVGDERSTLPRDATQVSECAAATRVSRAWTIPLSSSPPTSRRARWRGQEAHGSGGSGTIGAVSRGGSVIFAYGSGGLRPDKRPPRVDRVSLQRQCDITHRVKPYRHRAERSPRDCKVTGRLGRCPTYLGGNCPFRGLRRGSSHARYREPDRTVLGERGA